MATALVTGSGRGIGKAIAIELAAQGFDIALNDLADSEEIARTVDEVREKGVRCEFFAADVSKHEDVAAMCAEAEKELGAVEVLVCSAGINRDALFLRMKDEDWQAVLNVDLNAGDTRVPFDAAGKILLQNGCESGYMEPKGYCVSEVLNHVGNDL